MVYIFTPTQRFCTCTTAIKENLPLWQQGSAPMQLTIVVIVIYQMQHIHLYSINLNLLTVRFSDGDAP